MKYRLLAIGLVAILGFIGYNTLSAADNPTVIAENTFTFAVGDVNGDSYPDIIAAVTDSPQTLNLKLFLNHNGVFTEASSLLSIVPPAPDSPSVAPYIIKLADINNDTFPDIIVLARKKHQPNNLILLGAGNGVFQLADEKIIDKAFFTVGAIDISVLDINNDAKPEIILLNPEKSLVFSGQNNYFGLNADLTAPEITPEPPVTSLNIDINNTGLEELLKIDGKKLTLVPQTSVKSPNVKSAKSGSSALALSGIGTLATTQTLPPWSFKITALDGTDEITAKVGDLICVNLDTEAAAYIWGNAMVLYDASKLEAVSIEETPVEWGFWTWWTDATGMSQYGGGGHDYFYDGLYNSAHARIAEGSGQAWATQWKDWYGQGNAGPVGTIDAFYGTTVASNPTSADYQALIAKGLTASDIQKSGAIRIYTSTYSGGLYGSVPLRLYFRVKSGCPLNFWTLYNDWTSYSWHPVDLIYCILKTLTLNILGLDGVIAQLQNMIADANIPQDIKDLLTPALAACQAMKAELAKTTPDYQTFLTQMSTAMDKIARAAKALSALTPPIDIWYKLDQLIAIRREAITPDTNPGLTEDQSGSIVGLLKKTPPLTAVEWEAALNALKGTNEVLKTYLTGSLVDTIDKAKEQVITPLAAVPGGVTIIQSLANSIKGNYQDLYDDLLVSAPNAQQTQDLGDALADYDTRYTAGDYDGALTALRQWSTMTYPVFPAATLSQTTTAFKGAVTTSQSKKTNQSSCVLTTEIKGGKRIEAVIQPYIVQECGQNKVIFAAKDKTTGQEVKDIDHFQIECRGYSHGWNGSAGISHCYGRKKVEITDSVVYAWQDLATGAEKIPLVISGGVAEYAFPPIPAGQTQYSTTIKLTVTDGRVQTTDLMTAEVTVTITKDAITGEYQIAYTLGIPVYGSDELVTDVATPCVIEYTWLPPANISGNCTRTIDDYIGVNKPVLMGASGVTDATDKLLFVCTNCYAGGMDDTLPDVVRYQWQTSQPQAQGGFIAPSEYGENILYQASAASAAEDDITLTITPINFSTQSQETKTPPVTKQITAVSVNLDAPNDVIAVNKDDDDENEHSDFNDDQPVTNENDLMQLTFSVTPNGLTKGKAVLEVTKGAGKIMVWGVKNNNWSKIFDTTTKHEWNNLNALPDELWLEGITPSTEKNDVELQWRFEESGKIVTCDKVKMTVISVSFIEDTAQDYGFDNYTNPYLSWKSVKIASADRVKAETDSATLVNYVYFKSTDTSKVTVLPNQASLSPQTVTMAGIAKNGADIQANLKTVDGPNAATLKVATYNQIQKTVAIILVNEENDDDPVIEVGEGKPNATCVDTGSDGICDSTAGVGNVQLIPLGRGQPNQTAITAGTNGVLNTTPSGDDTIVGETITTGPNGICNTTKSGDDDQDIHLNKGKPDTAAIDTGEDGVCNTTKTGNDSQVIRVGEGQPNQICVSAGVNATLDTNASPDDTVSGENITTGPDGICNTTAKDTNTNVVFNQTETQVEDFINKVYNQAVIEWTVSILPAENVNYDLNRDGELEVATIGRTDEQQIIIDTVGLPKSGNYGKIVFIVNESNPRKTGFTWPGFQFAFVCAQISPDPKITIAHELGHATYSLPNLPDDTQNIMYYQFRSDKWRLRKNQWDDCNP